MAELMVDVITSLDGYSAAEGWPGLWGMGGPDYFAWLGEDTDGGRTCHSRPWSTARSTAVSR